MMYTLIDNREETLEVEENVLQLIPYFSGMLSVRNDLKTSLTEDNRILLESNILVMLLTPILTYIQNEKNVFYLLVGLPKHVEGECIADLLKLVDFLGLGEVELSTTNTHDKLTDVKDYGYSYDGDPTCDIPQARLTAAKSILGLHMGLHSLATPKEKSTMYNYILFIASHTRAFGSRLRYRASEAATKFCKFTAKQMVQIEGCNIETSINDSASDAMDDINDSSNKRPYYLNHNYDDYDGCDGNDDDDDDNYGNDYDD